MNYRQIWLQNFGILTEYQRARLQRKVAPKLYANIILIFARVETGYIVGLETNVNNNDEDIINYFVNTLLSSI